MCIWCNYSPYSVSDAVASVLPSCMLHRHAGVIAAVNTLQLLAGALGYSAVELQSAHPELLSKLADATAAGGGGGGGAGSSSSSKKGSGGGGNTSSRARRGSGDGGGTPPLAKGQAAADGAFQTDSPSAQFDPQQQQQQVSGQKRSSTEAELPMPALSKLATGVRNSSPAGAAAAAAAASAGSTPKACEAGGPPPPLLRLRLSEEDAAEQRQVLLQRQQQALLAAEDGHQKAPHNQQQQRKAGEEEEEEGELQLQDSQDQDDHNKQQQQQAGQGQGPYAAELALLDQLSGPTGLDVPLLQSQRTAGTSSAASATRCTGLTLTVDVSDMRELVDSR